MLVYALWAVQQRENTIVEEGRRETSAYATALALALDMAYRDRAGRGCRRSSTG